MSWEPSPLDWLWIPVTLTAAFSQSLRTALQKYLKGRLSTNGATFVRFLYGMPVAWAYLLLLVFLLEDPLPSPNPAFIGWVALGGAAQVAATALLVHVLGLRNFPVGVAYSKTEAVQAAVFGLVFLAEPVTAWGVAAILLGTLGVMLISLAGSSSSLRSFLLGWAEPSALLGIASGACFGVASVCFRAASLSLEHPSFLMSAGYALVWATTLQTILLFGWLAWRERDQFARLAAAWRPSAVAGLASVVGSACWFTAMTIQIVAYVRTLGMVELVFTFLLSVLWFRERPSAAEAIGTALVVFSVVMVLNPI
jgi:drug/metabolite transporter (DMT)-like permease